MNVKKESSSVPSDVTQAPPLIHFPQLEGMSRDERSMLLFIEAVSVDYGGAFDMRRINEDDRKILDQWQSDGFIKWGRIKIADITQTSSCIRSHWVTMDKDVVWLRAFEERRARCARMHEARNWRKTQEAGEG